jgi:site-specific recombinase XerD
MEFDRSDDQNHDDENEQNGDRDKSQDETTGPVEPDAGEEDPLAEYRPDGAASPERRRADLQGLFEEIEIRSETYEDLIEVLGGPGSAETRLLLHYFDGKSEHTIDSYGRALAEFFSLVDKPPQAVTRDDLLGYKRYCLEHRDNSPATVRGKLYAISAYFEEGLQPESATGDPLWDHNPVRTVSMKDLEVPRYSNANRIYLSEYRAIRNQFDCESEKGARDILLFDGFVFLGHRSTAWSQLTVGDFWFADGKLFYEYDCKWENEPQEGVVPPPLRGRLVHYIKQSGRFLESTLEETFESLPDQEAIFISASRNRESLRDRDGRDHHTPIHPNTPRDVLKEYGEEAEGVDPDDLTVHGLRDLSANLVDQQTDDKQDVQDHLNHRYFRTTELYLERQEDPENPFWQGIDQALTPDDEAA